MLPSLTTVPEAAERAIEVFADPGWGGARPRLKKTAVRRLDLAIDVEVHDRALGPAVLRAFTHLPGSRHKTNEWVRNGRTETISFHKTGKKSTLLARIYDKGIESGEMPAGRLFPFERQHRWEKAKQKSAPVMAGGGSRKTLARPV